MFYCNFQLYSLYYDNCDKCDTFDNALPKFESFDNNLKFEGKDNSKYYSWTDACFVSSSDFI